MNLNSLKKEKISRPIRKLVYVVRSPFPGPKAHHAAIVKMMDAFIRNGLQSSLLLRKYKKGFASSMKDYFGLDNEVKISSPLSLGFIPFPLDFLWRYFFERELCSISRDFPYGQMVLYYRYSRATGKYMANCARKSGLPFFCEVHTPLKSGKEIHYLKEMKGVVVITDCLRSHLMGLGVDPEKILMVPSGFDARLYDKKRLCSKEQIRNNLSVPLNRSLVVYTGKPYKGRGVETLIESFRFLSDSVMGLIVGCLPEDLKRLNGIVENCSLQDRVRLERHKPSNQIPSYQMIADVLVMPYSRTWNLQYSASPVKMFEYMASGNPIVSSDFPNIREVLSEKNSLLVPPDDPQLLAAGIQRCLEDRNFASSIAANALRDVNEYSWNNRAVKVMDFMNSLL